MRGKKLFLAVFVSLLSITSQRVEVKLNVSFWFFLFFFSVTPWMELKPNCGSDRAWVYSVPADYADEEIRPELLAIKFANPESMSVLLLLDLIGSCKTMLQFSNKTFLEHTNECRQISSLYFET